MYLYILYPLITAREQRLYSIECSSSSNFIKAGKVGSLRILWWQMARAAAAAAGEHRHDTTQRMLCEHFRTRLISSLTKFQAQGFS